ncbi:SDR family oxidoreductase [Microbacterium sp. SYP-A9085]|uniref:SDR family oxidoreductase n=1 Tax=Microbacterium sp. SYP-A9085 TaxID=2664454 RepID=UPI00129C0D47|nr:SDR family oxidoreductase [Microbacterium sp. SYP-A9085]MRH28761.1 SDR family oxidoreductase [Microbacterium sp. SYP-A9085]
MDLQLAGKRAIVTGGSAGIGFEIARQFALEGIDTAVCSRSIDRARAAIDMMGVAGGGRLVPIEVELRDADSVAAAVDRAVAELGGVDVLVNSGAEVSGNVPEDLANITDEFILRSFEDKFVGILRAVRGVVPHMRGQGYGRIINLAGHTSREAGAISAGARNSAVVNLTKALSLELGGDGITVNAIHPFTTMTRELPDRLTRMATRHGRTPEDHLVKISARTSLGRLVTAEEIAHFVAFLASPLSVALTGEVVALTGGVGDAVYF